MSKIPVRITKEMHEALIELNKAKTIFLDDLKDKLDKPRAKVELLTYKLLYEKFITRIEKEIKRIDLTKEGKLVLQNGLPENVILRELNNSETGISFKELSSKTKLSSRAANAAIGQLRKLNIVEIQKGVVKLTKPTNSLNSELEDLLKTINDNPEEEISPENERILTKRGLIEKKEKTYVQFKITPHGKKVLPHVQIIEIVSRLTPKHIRSGEWRNLELKEFKMEAEPKFIPTGRKHPYLSFLQDVKLKLIALGFEEMRGPLVETEFWNFDALFAAQDHPAREWSDVYQLKQPTHGKLPKDKKLVENVKLVHETGEPVGSKGWRYSWDPKKSAQLLLRPQGTAISARTLYGLKIPSMYFSIARCYRPDSVDATHLSEFNQMEGIVCDPSITFRDLLGLLKTFAKEVAGAAEVKVKPDYYPFTSPSVELSAKHPELGYIEFGGAGIFRPEVTAPFGIKDPVIAWGLGVDRLFMVNRGINDIRELFTHKLNWLREVPLI